MVIMSEKISMNIKALMFLFMTVINLPSVPTIPAHSHAPAMLVSMMPTVTVPSASRLMNGPMVPTHVPNSPPVPMSISHAKMACAPQKVSLANVPQDFLVTVSTVLILTNALTARLQLTS